MNFPAIILSLLLVSFPGWLLKFSENKIRIFSSLSYYGSDFDGDKINDLAVWDEKENTLYYQLSSSNKFYKKKFIDSSLRYTPVFADYDGDKITDFAFYQDRVGEWIIYKSTNPAVGDKFLLGSLGDVPLPGDFDGDKVFDRGLFRLHAALLFSFIKDKDGNKSPILYKVGDFQDDPMTADFDGDGKSDISFFRLGDGKWYTIKSSENFDFNKTTTEELGKQWDIIVPNDYNNDGKSDYAVYRPSEFTWHIKLNNDKKDLLKIQFGEKDEIPASADVSGDGIPELIMWNPVTKSWRVKILSTGQVSTLKWNVPDGCLPAISILHKFD